MRGEACLSRVLCSVPAPPPDSISEGRAFLSFFFALEEKQKLDHHRGNRLWPGLITAAELVAGAGW